jgi:agmatine deiminase
LISIHQTPDSLPTPQTRGLEWIAEWERHDATWIAWPHNLATWPNLFERIPPVFERLINILAEVEHVHLLGGPPAAHLAAQSVFEDHPNVTVHRVSTSDCWIRDYGPTFLVDRAAQTLAGIDWTFNAWGNKYHNYENDIAGAKRMCNILRCERISSPLVCEGGAMETDGAGTVMITPESFHTGSRNPGLSRLQIEEHLKLMLSARKVIWVEGGSLAGDDTDSHIDQLARFVAPGKVVVAMSANADVVNAEALKRQRQCLSESTDADGRTLEIIELLTPPARFVQGERVPESYCNFYLANEIVVVPRFGHRKSDERAASILQEQFPDRTIETLDTSDMIWGLGAIHCATQQQPAVPRA